MSVKARTEMNGKIAVIEIKGSLVGDGETDKFRTNVQDFIEQGNKCLIVDLGKVNYVNSSGIGALISAYTSYKKNGGEVKLSGINNNVLNLLAVTKLIDIFEVSDTVNEAMDKFANSK